MKCQVCGKYAATTHITKVINGQKSEVYLCPYCANQNGNAPVFNSILSGDFENFFGGLWGTPSEIEKPIANVCNVCGSSLRDIQSRGKLGCSNCYTVFGNYLLRPLKEIHGSNSHVGKIPQKAGQGIRIAGEIDKLKEELNRAVSEQNFEQAAKLRDKIKELEQNRG
ncbi:MAG: UvrB/UvrC motif-containing protein [Clostridia bacterium]|nr:UvrB/UvrC motif-containing protein [Clostridia bacterium]